MSRGYSCRHFEVSGYGNSCRYSFTNCDTLRPTGWPSPKSEIASEIRVYYNLRLELSVVRECLLRGSRVVVPSTLRQSLLELSYEGHPGVLRMKSTCRESIWWPGIDADVERAVCDCQACIISGKQSDRHLDHFNQFHCPLNHGGSCRSTSHANSMSPHALIVTRWCW
jgi:Integrase zinc binding domain